MLNWLYYACVYYMSFYAFTITRGIIVHCFIWNVSDNCKAIASGLYSTFIICFSVYLGYYGLVGIIDFFTMNSTNSLGFWYACFLSVMMINMTGLALWVIVVFLVSLFFAIAIICLWKCGLVDDSHVTIDGTNWLQILQSVSGVANNKL